MAAILSDDIFKHIFLNEDDKIPIQMSLKLVPRSPIDNKPALVQVMAWRKTNRYLNQCWPADEYMRHPGEMSWENRAYFPAFITTMI